MKGKITITFEDLPNNQMGVKVTVTKSVTMDNVLSVLDVTKEAIVKSNLSEINETPCGK